jgi:hypothetical protein
MWKGQGRSGYGESSTGGDYDDWSCLSRNGRQWKNPATMLTRDLSGADYWHIRKQMTDSYDVPLEVYAENDTVNLAHTLPNGKANLLAYADKPTLVVKSKVSIKDKILPQFKRLQTLQGMMLDLEKEYKTTDMTCAEYSMLRDVIVCKIARAEVLYRKAISVRPTPHEDDEYPDEMPEVEAVFYARNDDHRSSDTGIAGMAYPSWIGELSNENSLKNFLKIACKVVRKAVQFSQATRNYIKTLSEV